MEQTLKPALRFKGFTDTWEQYKFDSITFPSGVKNTDNLPLESYSITNEAGFIPQNIQFENGGTMRDADKSMYYIVSPRSFAYNPARINVGSIGYYNQSKNVIVSSLYEVFQTTDNIDDRFLWHWFKADHFQKLIEQYQEGGVRLYFYYDKLCKGHLPAPQLIEQRKIGSLLDNIDSLITLHQRRYDKLINTKKALLDKMFPKAGEVTPKLRFRGFADTWEQCELGQLISKGGSGGTPTSTNPNYYNGSIPFLSITDITNSNGYIYNTEKSITELGLNNSAAWLVPKEAISLAMYASVGKVAILKENVATSQAFYNLVIDDLSTRDYIFHFLKKMDMSRAWDSLISTGTQANLNAEKVKKLTMTIPADIDEQSRLGTLFNSIDSLITLHQCQYEKLKKLKKALFQKMFV